MSFELVRYYQITISIFDEFRTNPVRPSDSDETSIYQNNYRIIATYYFWYYGRFFPVSRHDPKEALSRFIAGTTVSANQIEFIDLVVSYLIENGVMEPERLYESPFTDINPQGPDGIFPSAEVDQLVNVLVDIRVKAAA